MALLKKTKKARKPETATSARVRETVAKEKAIRERRKAQRSAERFGASQITPAVLAEQAARNRKLSRKVDDRAKVYSGPSLGRKLRKTATDLVGGFYPVEPAVIVEAPTLRKRPMSYTPVVSQRAARENAEAAAKRGVHNSTLVGIGLSHVGRTLGVQGGWTVDLIHSEAHRDLTEQGLVYVQPSFLGGSKRFTARPSF
jgi:hypothetical protein